MYVLKRITFGIDRPELSDKTVFLRGSNNLADKADAYLLFPTKLDADWYKDRIVFALKEWDEKWIPEKKPYSSIAPILNTKEKCICERDILFTQGCQCCGGKKELKEERERKCL
jgi:hypothetical protein